MPVLVYFKNPQMSLLLEGSINKEYIRKLQKAFGKVLKMRNPDGEAVVLIARADCDISYVAEITQQKMDDMMKQQKAADARGSIETHKRMPSGGKGFRTKH